jgi:hypothetical protein
LTDFEDPSTKAVSGSGPVHDAQETMALPDRRTATLGMPVRRISSSRHRSFSSKPNASRMSWTLPRKELTASPQRVRAPLSMIKAHLRCGSAVRSASGLRYPRHPYVPPSGTAARPPLTSGESCLTHWSCSSCDHVRGSNNHGRHSPIRRWRAQPVSALIDFSFWPIVDSMYPAKRNWATTNSPIPVIIVSIAVSFL